MQVQLMWFPKLYPAISLTMLPRKSVILRRVAGASVLALLLVALFSTVSYAKSVPLKHGELPSVATQQESAQVDGNAGLVIVAIDEEGPAAQAGIARGDILLMVDGVPVNSSAELFRVVATAAAGIEVTLTVQHGDETRTIPVTLVQRGDRAYLGVQVVDPPGAAVAVEVIPPMVEAAPGNDTETEEAAQAEATAEETVEVVTATVVTGEGAAGEQIIFFGPGLIIAEVLPDGPAAAAGLVAGDLIAAIDGVPIGLPEELVKILLGYAPGDGVTLTVQKGGPVGAAIVKVPVTLGAASDDAGRAYLGIRFLSAPAGVTVEAFPPTGEIYTAPAVPVVPPVPAVPEVAPYYGYPGAYAGEACGSSGVTINQYFYGPGYGASPAVPFTMALPPMISAQPAIPADPYFIYHSGVNPEIYTYGASGQVEKDVIFYRAAPAMPGVEVQGFEVQLQPGGDVIAWKKEALAQEQKELFAYKSPFTYAYPGIPTDVTTYDEFKKKEVILKGSQAEAQMMWTTPIPGQVAGEVGATPVWVYGPDAKASAGAVTKSFTVQVAPESGAVQVVPLEPTAGVAVSQPAPVVVPALPATDGWY